MGKKLISKYPSEIVKNSVKVKIKKHVNRAEKHENKRQLSSGQENEPPYKKTKIDDTTLKQCVVTNHDLSLDLDSRERVVKHGNYVYLQTTDCHMVDLFCVDELKNTYFQNIVRDFYWNLIEEISLEGLDGITLEALWKRLSYIELPLLLNNILKEIVWRIILQNTSFQFYELPTPRDNLKICDYLANFDFDGVVVEMTPQEKDIYPIEIINDPNVQGSCSTYYSRVEISDVIRNKSLQEVQGEYGNKLVIVANQILRRAVLMENADPLLELPNIEFCILECIGRSRKHGVLTQGKMSLPNKFKMDSKSVFHYKKHMIRSRLIEKQFFYIRSLATEQNKTGRLLHLRKFYTKFKTKQLVFFEQIVNILKSQPSYRMPTSVLRKNFEDMEHVMKITRSSIFRKFIKFDCVYPYRSIYPNAKKSEYLYKNSKREKGIRCYELMDPYINVPAIYKNDDDVDSDDDDDEEGEEEVSEGKLFNMELFREVYMHILSKGREGCSRRDISKLVGVDKNSIRMAVKKLVAKNVIHIKRVDRGKQRLLVYYAKFLDHDEEPVVSNTNLEIKVSTVKDKLKQRQSAAIARRNQIENRENLAVAESVSKKVKKVDINTKIFKCNYFLKETEKLPILNEEFSINVSCLIARRFCVVKLYQTLQDGSFLFKADIQSCINLLPQAIANFQTYYSEKNQYDYMTKLILLKATFGEIKVNEYIESFSRKRKISNQDVPITQDIHKSERELRTYIGKNPITAFVNKENNFEIKLIVSSTPKNYNYDLIYQKPDFMSDKIASRIQIILDAINKHKIFDQFSSLTKLIIEQELEKGYQIKIDRKSLIRILIKLVEEGFIKMYQLVITDGNITKTQIFICHPTVTNNDSVFETVTQQIKFRYFKQNRSQSGVNEEPISGPSTTCNVPVKPEDAAGPSPFKETDVVESITLLKAVKNDGDQPTESSVKYVKSVAKLRGLKPKFVRMRVFHELLFFLIYGYEASGQPLSETVVSRLFKSHHINLTEEDMKSMPEIYFEELSWKMFISPLPHHKSWQTGWALMCDIILRMPISVLCKVHSVTIKSPELEELLSHPIKRFYLLKDIPRSICTAIFFKRKYLSNIFDSLNKLAFCGLIQMGPRKSKEMDQAFIYLNRKASLLDTRTSEPGYNKISVQDYPKLNFYFETMADVDQYWYQMYFISLNTKLNQRPVGLIVTYTDVRAKENLMDTLKHRSAEEAPLRDTGDIPGDNRGAAGIDSALWVHIARNWFWAKVKRKESSKTPAVLGLERERMLKVNSTPISFKNLHIKSTSNKIYLFNTLREGDTPKKKDKLYVSIPFKTSRKQQGFIKKIPKRPKPVQKQYFDAIDKAIAKKNGPTIKVKWTNKEDHWLMLCKAGDLFLNPKKSHKQQIYYNFIRDILHRVLPQSRNKTSRACQRRIKLLLRGKYQHLKEEVSNLLKIDEIYTYYYPLINMLIDQNPDNKITEKECIVAFVILMSYIFKNEKEVVNVLKGSMIDHLSPKNLPYSENNLLETTHSLKFSDPMCDEDIKKDVLKSVIHSTLTSKNQPDWALHLFKIYQKFQDTLIKSAVEELKLTQTVSCKKFNVKKNRISWQMPFKLSQSYISFQFTTFNVVTALESFKTFSAIKQNVINDTLDFSKEVVDSKKYGQLLGINEFCSFWEKIQFNIRLPLYTVILNPDMTDHTELISILALGLRIRLKKNVQESKAEEEQENQDMSHEPLSSADEDLIDGCSTNLLQISDDIDSEIRQDLQSNPLELPSDVGNNETIDRLKNWITDCMERDRSPSPDFIKSAPEIGGTDETNQPDQSLLENEHENLVSMGKMDLGYIPTLEEIKEDMMKEPVANEDRIVPYITELSDLLTKDNFIGHNIDEEKLEQLKTHFITQYAQLESLHVNEQNNLQEHYFVEFIETHSKNKNIWKKIQSEMVVGEVAEEELDIVSQLILEQGGTQEDVLLCNEISCFLMEKGLYGATGPELKEKFFTSVKNLALTTIMQILTDHKIILRVGICTLRFVHYAYYQTWIIETFHLTTEERDNIKDDENQEEFIQKQLEKKKVIKIKVSPWTQLNGTINYQTLNIWLSSILSYCLEAPKVPFTKLCEKFCYLKPADIFTLLEILEELGCIELTLYEQQKPTLFSVWMPPKEQNANFLDDLKSIVISTNGMSMTLLGSFINDSLDKWKLE